MTDLAALRKAIEVLLRQENYQALKQEIFALAKTDHGGFAGPLFVLDPLVEVVRYKPADKVGDLFALCDSYYQRRHPEHAPSRKTAYQRTYMAERRRRLNKAIKLKQRIDDALMNATMKEEFRQEMQAWWMVVQEEWLEERGGTKSPELVREFWEEIDADLEAGLSGDEAAARKVLGM